MPISRALALKHEAGLIVIARDVPITDFFFFFLSQRPRISRASLRQVGRTARGVSDGMIMSIFNTCQADRACN